MIHKQKILWSQKLREEKEREVDEMAQYLSRVSMGRNMDQLQEHVRQMRANLLNVEGAIRRSEAVDHWVSIPPQRPQDMRAGRTVKEYLPPMVPTVLVGGSTSPWEERLKHVQENQWESYSKTRDTFNTN